jgi:hypothetical protein
VWRSRIDLRGNHARRRRWNDFQQLGRVLHELEQLWRLQQFRRLRQQ